MSFILYLAFFALSLCLAQVRLSKAATIDALIARQQVLLAAAQEAREAGDRKAYVRNPDNRGEDRLCTWHEINVELDSIDAQLKAERDR